jgi:hypothetical protein
MAPAAAPARPAVTERDLDAAVRRIHAAKADAAASYHALGREVAAVHDRGLWKHRRGDGGACPYKSFDAFVRAELELSTQHAHQRRADAAKFSEAQVRALGTSKLGLVLQLPPGDEQARGLAMAEGGASKREIEAHVREVKAETGYQKPSSGRPVPHNAGRKREVGTTGRATSDAAPGKSPDTRITLAMWTGRSDVELRKKGDRYVGALALENDGVELRFSARVRRGTVALTVTAKRREAP